MKKIFISALLMILCFSSYAYDRPKIYSLINREITISNFFAGESITLVKEKEDYFIIRKIFGSGRPVIKQLKYRVRFSSDYQLRFSEIINSEEDNKPESFTLSVIDKDNVKLFLNGLEVVIKKF